MSELNDAERAKGLVLEFAYALARHGSGHSIYGLQPVTDAREALIAHLNAMQARIDAAELAYERLRDYVEGFEPRLLESFDSFQSFIARSKA